MLGNYAISNLIREARTHEIPGIIEVSSQQGMHSMDQGLEQLVKEGVITINDALACAQKPDILKSRLLTGIVKTKEPKSVTHHTK